MSFKFKLNICSLNARGLRNANKLHKVLNYCNEKKFNTLFLQETFVTSDILVSFDKKVNKYGTTFHSISCTPHVRGVAIVLSKDFPEYKVLHIQTDTQGRKVMVNLELNISKMTNLNQHLCAKSFEPWNHVILKPLIMF